MSLADISLQLALGSNIGLYTTIYCRVCKSSV